VSLEQQAVEEEAEEDEGATNYQPMAPADDGKLTLSYYTIELYNAYQRSSTGH
jgi:hypothetical protein